MKRLLTPALAAAASLLLLAGCGGTAATTTTTAASGAASQASKVYEIGINQFVTVDALDAVTTGFKKAFADNGIKANFDVKNPQTDAATNTAIANAFASGKKDLVLGIATPSAQALAQAIKDIPVLFAAVTDPLGAKLVKDLKAPGGNVTGTSDLNKIEDQLKLIKDIAPNAKSVGIVYTSGEPNAVAQLKLVEAAAPALGLTVKSVGVTNASEIQQAANTLAVDSFFVGTDNNVVKGISALVGVAEAKKIPLIAADGSTVKSGPLAGVGVDYEKLGYQTGLMAIKILKGEAKPATMPVEYQAEYVLTINKAAIAKLGLTVPAAWAKGVDVGTK